VVALDAVPDVEQTIDALILVGHSTHIEYLTTLLGRVVDRGG
jgi:hypothetical protein